MYGVHTDEKCHNAGVADSKYAYMVALGRYMKSKVWMDERKVRH